jgi:sugar transferase (PEP-CTERM/EpsH1 system associated)
MDFKTNLTPEATYVRDFRQPARHGRLSVVHLVLSLNIGGLEMVVLNLVQHIDRSRFHVRVLCLQELGLLADRCRAMGIPIESLECRQQSKIQTLKRLKRRLAALRPDILHTHNPSPHIFGAVAARLTGVPVVIHTKHGRNYPSAFISVALNRLAASLSDSVVAVSEDAGRVASQVERIPARKLLVIRNGIELPPCPASSTANPTQGKRAVHVARLHPIKDQATLLRAARIVADVEPTFHLDIVGDGPAAAELATLTGRLNLSQHVRFLGYRSDVEAMLAGADMFVLSSVSEGISLTLLEAMAAGLAVVATDVGGNREVIARSETGLLVTAQSPEALAEAILTLLRDPALARAMGQAGRQRVERLFDLRQTVSQYELLYSQLWRRKHPLAGNRPVRSGPHQSIGHCHADRSRRFVCEI